MPDSVNEILQDRALSHRIGLDQVAGSIRNDVISLLNESDDDIEERLQFRLGRELSEDAVRPQQLSVLRQEIQDINEEVMKDVTLRWKERFRKVSKSEGEGSSRDLQRAIPVDIDPSVPSENQLTALVATNPIEGQTLSGWADKIEQDRTNKIIDEVRKGIVEGDANQEIVDRVMGTRQFGFKDGVLNSSRQNVAAITRTAVTEFSSTAREMTFNQNRNVVKKVEYRATLDLRTSVICSTLDGRIFNIGQGPRPPQHHNCRSVSQAITKSWREMGLDRDELSSSTRASMDGQVPAGEDFEEFLTKKSSDAQKKVLGKTRMELWKNGDLELEDFLKNGVRQHNEVLSVRQLRQQNEELFEELGL